MGATSSRRERNNALQLKFDKQNIPGFKVVLLGEPKAGKSSIFLRYGHNQFDFSYRPTRRAYVENIVKKINVPSDMVAGLTLWDLPGEDDMDLRESYYRNADAAIVVVDMNDDWSIEMASVWKQEFVNKVSRVKLVHKASSDGVVTSRQEQLPCDGKEVPVLLLGNKYDLVEEQLEQDKIQNLLQSERNQSEANTADIHFDEESDSDEEDTLGFLSGLRSRRDKPPSVQLLHKVEQEHGFVGSVMVSAKTGDNSVHAAFQSLIRYLIEHSGHGPPKKKIETKRRKTIYETESSMFAATGVDELDEMFTRCVRRIKRCTDYQEYYRIVFRRWKQSCLDLTYLSEPRASLEDTIIGVRKGLLELGLILQIQDKDDFVQLRTKEDTQRRIPRDVKLHLDLFNKEYAQVCRIILRDLPSLQNFLTHIDGAIEAKCKELWENRAGTDEQSLQRSLDICDRNQAKIWHCKAENEELLSTVQNVRGKIEAALAWSVIKE